MIGMNTSSMTGYWQALSVSVCGTSHEKSGKPCQDANCFRIFENDILIAAIADGAGSAALADIGAQTAAEAAVEFISQNLDRDNQDWESLLTEALRSAKATVEQAAIEYQAKPRDLATTLIVTVTTPELIAAIQVGDGAIVVEDTPNHVFALTIPQFGEYLNEATFITSPDAIETAQTQIYRNPITNLAIFSDGLQMLALKIPEGTPHAPFFEPLFRFVSEVEDREMAKIQLENFLRSPRVQERTDDDLTLLLATWVPQPDYETTSTIK